MNINLLFLNTLEDMERRLGQNDPYELLQLAGLLRKLLLDDFPLVDQVNRPHRVKLSFDIGASRPPTFDGKPPTLWTTQDGLDPDTAPPGMRRISATRDAFLAQVVTQAETMSYSVKDIILFGANIAGAVHAGVPKADKDITLKHVDQIFVVGGHAVALRQLKAIGRVALKALKPLRERVTASLPAPRAQPGKSRGPYSGNPH